MYFKINLYTCISTFLAYAMNVVATPCLVNEKCGVQSSEYWNMQFRKILQDLLDGVPELGIEKLDKMKFDLIEMKKDGLIYIMKNIEVECLNDAVIDDFGIDMMFKIIKLSFHTNFKIDCEYTASGNLFSLPVEGAGKARLTKENVNMELLFNFDIVKNESEKHVIDLQSYYYGADVRGGATYYYENVFNGDKEKSDRIHTFLNRYWKTTSSNHERFLFNKVNDKIFNALKIYLRTVPFEEVSTLNEVDEKNNASGVSIRHNVFQCLSDNAN